MTAAPSKLPKGEITRQRILDAGEVVFAELGYAAARLEDVANAVGIRRASIVYYFKNKQELYDAVEAGIFGALEIDTQDRLQGGRTAVEQLQRLFDCWLEFMVGRPTAARIIMRNSADITPRSSNPVECSDGTLCALEGILARGVAEGEFNPIEPALFLSIAGGSIINYVCFSQLFGAGRIYDPRDPQRLESFRALLHRTWRALVLARPQPEPDAP